MLHRVVLEAFRGPASDGMECLHEDDDKTNCQLSNLSWGTHDENMKTAALKGRLSSRFSVETIIKMREACSRGERRSDVAARFGCAVAYLNQVARGDRRKLVA
jgi:hypothetical protein